MRATKFSVRAKSLAGVVSLVLFGITPSASAQTAMPEEHDPSRIEGSYIVKEGRPIGNTILQLQQALLVPINYEEVPYESDAELRHFEQDTIFGRKTFRVPKSSTEFTGTLSAADSSPYLALHTMFVQFRQAGLPGADDYKIVEHDGYLDVFPAQVLAVNGLKRPVTPVMKNPITFPESERLADETIDLLVSEIAKASGKKVAVTLDPFVRMPPMVRLGASSELPSEVLAKLARSIGVTLSYQCLYDASDLKYYVNIYPVVAKISGNLYKTGRRENSRSSAIPTSFSRRMRNRSHTFRKLTLCLVCWGQCSTDHLTPLGSAFY